MRLIDADALLESLGEGPMSWTDTPEEIQALDDWREFVSAINDAPTVGEWISVEDRLPDDGEKLSIEAKWVLVWLGVEPFQTYFPLPAKYNWFSKTWTVVGLSDDMNKRVKITHWMPLPEPPKEAEQG